MDTFNSSEVDNDNSTVLQSPSFVRNSALFLLKLKEIHKVSQTAINEVTEEIAEFTRQGLLELKSKIHCVLQANDIDPGEVTGLENVFTYNFLFNPFNCLTSEYLQNKYYEENLKLVVSPNRLVFYIVM